MAIDCLVLGNPLAFFFHSSISHRLFFSDLEIDKHSQNSRFSGAGQEVGKSCVVVSINGKRIMFDCGMHMGFLDHRRYPDFSLIPMPDKGSNFDDALDCIIITHL
ncbi:Cleavage and polyadenylation specificity factor subunit 3-II [Morus notabilis]|uniref:Cleavage and polyadenylation specificity factor subunit 3-II n=1 Tax=Morus notabilis TaxID=981085 RepID=W9SM61_9ROSA|nr:Cleavage and polyadenylation specificity factor subunit 3-II [Morus notabilis]